MNKREILTTIVLAFLIATMVTGLAIFICWSLYELGVIAQIEPEIKTDIKRLAYSCPPVLTEEECYWRIELAIMNDWDVEDYLVSVWNRLRY